VSRINPLAREIVAKIVYYGPGLSGKTTSLKTIHTKLPQDHRGDMVSLATETDRTIFFDFLPVRLERVRNMTVRLQLYTVPGQVFYASTRKLVLNGADGVVFVADSQAQARERNVESWRDLEDNLAELDIPLKDFPHVIQYNKRDLPNVLPVSELERDLNLYQVPSFETAATLGTGVFPALKEIMKSVLLALKRERDEAQARRAPAAAFTSVGDSLAAAVSDAALRSAEGAPVMEPITSPEIPKPRSSKFSFRELWQGSPDQETVDEIEFSISAGDYGTAVREAAATMVSLLENLPGAAEADGHMSRATLLGIDGREYLNLAHLASAPEETLRENDALFALYLLVGARFKLRASQPLPSGEIVS
jgi:signal recognition particle receptor subunit beta